AKRCRGGRPGQPLALKRWCSPAEGAGTGSANGSPAAKRGGLPYEAQQSPGPEIRLGATRAPLLRSRLGRCHRFLRRDHPPPNGSAFIHDDLVETSVPRVQGERGGCAGRRLPYCYLKMNVAGLLVALVPFEAAAA